MPKELLNSILEFGKTSHNVLTPKVTLFTEKTFQQLDTSGTCTCQRFAIDYDETIKSIGKTMPITVGKSADALIINPAKEKIDFVELKSCEKFIQYIKPPQKNQNFIYNKIDGYNFQKKIRDSWYAFDTILRINHCPFQLSVTKNQEILENIKKNFYVSIDINFNDGLLVLLASLDFLAAAPTSNKDIEEVMLLGFSNTINNINGSPSQKLVFNEIKLISHSNLDSLY